ncbi:MAG: enoyl-CoA hydratase/isomerase family protein [Chloroflexi bacterium]|nr:enoyl-CoA hydratase/isomerase family protein [Chloroflexota bacterium]
MAYEYIIYEKKNGIAYITINRPEVRNALHAWANAELTSAFSDFRDDPDTWIAILTGAEDKSFSAGNDLKATADLNSGKITRPLPSPMPHFGGITSGFECYKPIIAAVNGSALGGGTEIALACDIIIAADHAKFGLPEPLRGLVAGTGVHRLPRQIPLKLAMGIMLTGRAISAQEAHRLGLVNEVVPYAELIPAAERWANEILECAPLSIMGVKEAVLKGLQFTVDLAIEHKYEYVGRAMRSRDAAEGPRAFAEKRKPVWKGR